MKLGRKLDAALQPVLVRVVILVTSIRSRVRSHGFEAFHSGAEREEG